MFAPENYIRWSDLVLELHEWAHRILLAYELEQVDEDPSFAFKYDTQAEVSRLMLARKNSANDEANFGHILGEIEFTNSLVMYVHLSQILMNFDTLICSNSGQTMRAPLPLLLHSDRLDWCGVDWPLRKNAQFNMLFKYFDRGTFDGQSLADRFCFIDSFTGTVTLKNNSLKTMLHASHLDLNSDDVERFFQVGVKPFLGYSIVWNNKNFPSDMVELLSSLDQFEPHWNVAEFFDPIAAEEMKKKRRGPKPTGARDEYLRRYPNGKPSNLSFDAIAAELADAGFPISARQIQNYERSRTIT